MNSNIYFRKRKDTVSSRNATDQARPLAVGVAIYGIWEFSNADDFVVRLYAKPFMAMSYARSAQVKFGNAHAASADFYCKM